MTDRIDSAAAWTAFASRDRGADGTFVAAVHSTGIFCRASCPARRPRRDGVTFYPTAEAAEAAGFRACRRCLPRSVPRDREAVLAATAILRAAEAPITLAALAARVGYAPHHFQRLFKAAVGLSPAAYARALRADRAADLIGRGSVTDTVYEAGYSAPSRFYADAAPRLGMPPARRAAGAPGERIAWTRVATGLGPLLVAATARGFCRVAFDEDGEALATRFPAASIERGDAELEALARRVVAEVDRPTGDASLPLDVRGTAFQEAVWRALATIPPGETRTYGELAALAGAAGASRAAGSACAANPLAVIVPCHRVRRADGDLGGYAWGPDRKAALLAREWNAG